MPAPTGRYNPVMTARDGESASRRASAVPLGLRPPLESGVPAGGTAEVGRIVGRHRPPGSKSIAQRVLVAAGL